MEEGRAIAMKRKKENAGQREGYPTALDERAVTIL